MFLRNARQEVHKKLVSMNTCDVDETKKTELIPADILNPTRNKVGVNPLNAELNSTCQLLALLAHYFLHVSRIRVNTRH